MKQAAQRFGNWFENLRFAEQITVFYGSIVAIIVIILLALAPSIKANREAVHAANVAHCMHAFGYTPDQCEFIIKHRVMVTR